MTEIPLTRKPRRRPFYGWWIVSVSTIGHALSGGFYVFGFGNFFMPLVQEFGWSRAVTSAAFSLRSLEGGLLGPVGGFLIDRFGTRKMMLFGIVLIGTGFILFSQVTSLLAYYLVFTLLIAIGVTLGIHQACIVTVNNWFIKKRGIALGLGQMGMGLGGLIVPVVGFLIMQNGWRAAAVVMGLAIWAIGIPFALTIRHRPEQMGLLPDGDEAPPGTEAESKSGKSPAAYQSESDFTPRQALHTGVFWLLTVTFGLRLLITGAVTVHQIPFVIGLGASPALAAATLGSMALITVPGRLGFGRLADIMPKKHVLAICNGLIALGLFLLAVIQTWWQVIPFLIIYAPAYGGAAILMNAIRGEYFGRRHYATIMGLMEIIQMFGVVLGPISAGWIFDLTGSYRLAFLIFGVLAALATVLTFFARRPTLPRTAG